MNCPKCQFQMPFQERICRRCQYCPESDDFIRTQAPRGGRRRIERKRLRTVMRDRFVPQSVIQREFPASVVLAFSILPGFAHVLVGRFYEGLFFLVTIIGLVYLALLSDFDTWTSLTALGVAFGLHVASIVRVTSLAKEFGGHIRASAHMLLILLLSLVVYSPLSRTLMSLKPQFVMDRSDYRIVDGHQPRVPADVMSGYPTRFQSIDVGTVFSTLVFGFFIFVIAWALGAVLSYIFSLPEKRRT